MIMDDLQNILLLDIETVAGIEKYEALSDRMKVQWARKAGYFKQRDEDQTEEDLYHQRAGIYAEFGKIIVIAIGRNQSILSSLSCGIN